MCMLSVGPKCKSAQSDEADRTIQQHQQVVHHGDCEGGEFEIARACSTAYYRSGGGKLKRSYLPCTHTYIILHVHYQHLEHAHTPPPGKHANNHRHARTHACTLTHI